VAGLLYFGVKFIAYTFWCYIALAKLSHAGKPAFPRALAFGFLRLFMGLFFGVLIWFLSAALMSLLGYGLPQNVLTYLLAYIPVRWVEWTIMAVILLPGSFSFSQWSIGTSVQDRLWRFGGIAISCLADIPMIIDLGGVIPTGRFLC
jgi:hypothetical protein